MSTLTRYKLNTVKEDNAALIIKIISYTVITIFSLICMIPFVIMITNSFASDSSLRANGFTLWPSEFSSFAYKIVLFDNPSAIIGSYIVTIGITVMGTLVGLYIIGMTGYALQRPDFPYRNVISFFFYFTTLFSGGLIPYYLVMVKYLGLQGNYLSILLPSLLSPWLIILMKSFLKGIPHAITESAKIDGAGDMKIWWSIVRPMATPALATIGLFLALGYWNEWYNAMLFLNGVKHQPLQLFLYSVINKADFIRSSAAAANIPVQDMPGDSLKMAVACVSTGPIILLYPFVQRFFISGITIGAVKG